ncbi:GTPase HflX [Spirochaetia bacterium]|nr:GTPase HflX [Spirochaetia bacterium]
MRELQNTEVAPKRALLIGIREERGAKAEADSLSRELAALAGTLGLEIAAQEIVHIRENHSKFGVGTGKAEEIKEKAAELGVDCLVFYREITPSQQWNWEKLTGLPAVDRQELIIRIFADRAKTREAELQISLAELSYSLPRLNHKYINLSRQRGGSYGAKGAGETKFETDRRRAEQRIDRLKDELVRVRKNRDTQRKKREKAAIPSCALVGYTNAGKSSLLNALSAADSLVEDKLFATLDPTTRRLDRPNSQPVLLVDTVGFIRRLPHDLVDAFHSTLEEVTLANMLIHVLDASDPDIDHYYETTLAVLRDLGAENTPVIVALNKTDRFCAGDAGAEGDAQEALSTLQNRYPGSIPVSAKTGAGLDELLARIDGMLQKPALRFRFPPDRHDLAALLYRNGTVLSEKYEDTYIEMEARVEVQAAERLKVFAV